jgi:peptidoglycan hydrolase-like protein with peptidoglycan-binding domain
MRLKEFITDYFDKTSTIMVPRGTRGPAVADLQKALVALGYELPKHGVDGFRGPETSAAIKKFQKDNALTQTSSPDKAMIDLINKKLKDSNLKITRSTEADVKPGQNLQQPSSTSKTRTSTKTGIRTGTNNNYVDPKQVAEYLKTKGLDRNHTLGILANIQGESGFNSAAYNANDSGARAIGFFQHRAQRADDLEDYYPDWRTNWQGQIDYALSEAEGRRYLQEKFRSPEEATAWFTRYFERPKHVDLDIQRRIKYLPRFSVK